MSAQIKAVSTFRRMAPQDLDAIMDIEQAIYTHPWTRGNFADSLHEGNHSWVMEHDGNLIGYAVLSTGAGEAHLLNLSIAADWQRQGWGRELLLFVLADVCEQGAQKIFLEVRVSNTAAQQMYLKMRFRQIGMRRDYYPAHGGREDALVLEYIP